MDHSARRDPGRARTTYQTRLRGLNPSLANARCGKVKQSRLRPISLAGFNLITEALAALVYKIAMFERMGHFMGRHNLVSQFYQEDDKAER